MVAGPSVTIGHQLNESKRLNPLQYASIFRSKHIEADSSGKVVAKSIPITSPANSEYTQDWEGEFDKLWQRYKEEWQTKFW
jgi:hypothetical protein